MGLEFSEIEYNGVVNITSEINIKESRKIRKQKIERNKTYHKKNPKSVDYYNSLAALQSSSLNNEQIASVILKKDIICDIIPVVLQEDTPINTIEQFNMKEKIMNYDIVEITQEDTSNKKPVKKDSSRSNKQYKNSRSKNSNKQNSAKKPQEKNDDILSFKAKNHLQLMFQALVKSFKRDGVFLESQTHYDSLLVMKDYNVQTHIGKSKPSLSIRAVVGEYTNFKTLVLSHPNNFSLLKQDFQNWWNSASQKFNAQDQLDNKIKTVFDKYSGMPHVKNFISNLENKLISVLKKPAKQPNGFIKKIDQIDALWLEEAQEISHIEQIEDQLNFKSYEESFPLARKIGRKFSIYIGKTNSGKTYAAMNELASAKSGVYLAPLRLMAQEGQESLTSRDVIADLVTGEEQKCHPDSTHVSSTVEMCNMSKVVDVAVIDEIQMISDESRGWAWSQALIGAPAKHVITVGSEEALPYILPILKELGEPYEIKRFERKTPLDIGSTVYKLKELKAGDCVVVFSRKSALEMKNAIEATGKRCSVIYGNLSPDVRRSEANKFKSGDNPILVATDAIGMGLNLPIKRIFFSTLQKYDGFETRYLNSSEIKQIAGRAGRYGLAEKGEVSILANDSHSDLTILHKAIYGDYEKPHDTRISISPNLKQIQTICNTLGKQDLYSALIFFKEKLIRDNKLYKAANLESMIEIASLIKTKNLDLATGLNYACVPLDTNSEVHLKTFFKWLNNHTASRENPSPELPDVVILEKNDSYSLYEAENYVKLLMAYRWLHYKYSDIYTEIEDVVFNAQTTNSFIERSLHKHIVISNSPKWRK